MANKSNPVLSVNFYLQLIVFIAAAVSLIIRWDQLDIIHRLAHVIVFGLILHEFEEYRFPGGFPFGFNVARGSSNPERYKLNKMSSFIVNTVAPIVALVLLFWMPSPIVAACFAIFGCVEFIVHTIVGTILFKKFRDKGKETIYFPGSATCWFIFIPTSIAIFYELATRNLLSPLEWVLSFVYVVIFAAIVINLPQKIFLNINSPYIWNEEHFQGYFKKFLD